MPNILEVTTEDAPSIAVGKPVSTNASAWGNDSKYLVDGDNNEPWVTDEVANI